jgi:hypothetical protein
MVTLKNLSTREQITLSLEDAILKKKIWELENLRFKIFAIVV